MLSFAEYPQNHDSRLYSQLTVIILKIPETFRCQEMVELLAIVREAQSTQDAGRDARTNWNIFPLMLLACSVNTPIHAHRFHLLCVGLRVARPVWMRPRAG